MKKENEAFENPIDKDKVTDTPGLLEYAHTVGSAVIRPEDKGKIKGRAMAAMYEQTDAHLMQIKEQIDLLAKQAMRIEERRRLSEDIYQSKISFQPIIGHRYYFYEKDDGGHVLSMLSPNEWGRKKPNWELKAQVRLMADHTWEIIDHE